jgi:hypothetical protein
MKEEARLCREHRWTKPKFWPGCARPIRSGWRNCGARPMKRAGARRRRGAFARAGGNLEFLRAAVRLLRPARRQRPLAATGWRPMKSLAAARQAVALRLRHGGAAGRRGLRPHRRRLADIIRRIKKETPLAVTLEPGRAAGGRFGRLARSRGGPLPAAV